MSIKMYDKNGNSSIVDNRDVAVKQKAGWTFTKPAVVACATCDNVKCTCDDTTSTKPRRKATLRIQKAEAEVLKPKEEEN